MVGVHTDDKQVANNVLLVCSFDPADYLLKLDNIAEVSAEYVCIAAVITHAAPAVRPAATAYTFRQTPAGADL